MLVRLLEVIWYYRRGWQTIKYPHPDWFTIEFWIDRMDRDKIPILDLHIGEHIPGDEPELALNILGGRDEYALMIYDRGNILYYYDSSRGDSVIEILESDRGSYQSTKSLCNDRNLLLLITRYFTETGKAFPGVEWRD
ncbi:hypothetical protein CKA32_003168 [Geitlerinema sp. FC II]|nr:hypothetical protein CKA32_003168 [Geitlerinema sp. FC II]